MQRLPWQAKRREKERKRHGSLPPQDKETTGDGLGGELHHYRYEWSNRAEGQDRIRLISRERARYEMAYLPKGSTVTKDGMRYLVFGSGF